MSDVVYKKINRKACKENLLLIKSILDKENIPFRLGYGTLLGAVRDKNFIKGDNDIDLLFDFIYRENVKKILFVLSGHGFVLNRCTRNFVSLSRLGVTIDFYFFSQRNLIDKLFDRVTCSFGLFCVYVDKLYWDETTTIEFIGKPFLVFKDYEIWLMQVYGADWRIPQDKKGSAKTFFSGIIYGSWKWLRPKLPKELLKKVVGTYRGLFK